MSKQSITFDELWKGIIEDLDRHFLAKHFPDIYPQIDFSKPIKFLDKELSQLMPESEDTNRRVDKLMQITLKTGKQRLILIHPEVHGYRLDNFAEREFIYFYRIYDRFKLPIVSLVIFTDTDPNYEPDCYVYEFCGTELTFKYRTFKILKQNPAELEASEYLFDAVHLTAYWAIQRKRNLLSEEILVDLKIDLMRRLLKKTDDKETIRKLLQFIKAYIRFEKPEIKLKFEKSYEEILKIEPPMGVTEIINRQAKQEGRQEGRLEGRLEEAKRNRERNKKSVQKLRLIGYSLENIADILFLTSDELNDLIKENEEEVS